MEETAEIAELRNKLRMMKFPQEELIGVMRHLQKAISKQGSANECLLHQIQDYEDQLTEHEKQIEDFKSDQKRNNLVNLLKLYSNNQGILESDLKAEEEKRKALEEELSKEQTKIGGMFFQFKKNDNLDKRLRFLENRLHQGYVRYCSNLNLLTEKRFLVDQLRVFKKNFFETRIKHCKEKENCDAHLGMLIQESNQMYMERDRNKLTLQHLHIAEKEDFQNFENESTRIDAKIETEKMIRKNGNELTHGLSSFSGSTVQQTDQSFDELIGQVDLFQIEITQILEGTKTTDLHHLLDLYDSLEMKNFSYMRIIFEKDALNLKLLDLIEKRKKTIIKLHEDHKQEQENSGEVIEQLSQKIIEVDRNIKEQTIRQEHVLTSFRTISEKLTDLANRLEVDTRESPDGKTTVSFFNFDFFLTQIEMKISDFVERLNERAMFDSISIASSELLKENVVVQNSHDTTEHVSQDNSLRDSITRSALPDLINSRPLTRQEINDLI